MAGWGEKFNKVTLSAISKGKEVAEITKLNMEISSLNQNLKEAQAQIGAYVMEQGLFAEDETIAQLCEKARKVQADIAADQEKLKALKNVQICPACGAEVPRTSKFCNKCGAPITQPEPVPAAEEEPQTFCTECGAPLEKGAVFCANCGARQASEENNPSKAEQESGEAAQQEQEMQE